MKTLMMTLVLASSLTAGRYHDNDIQPIPEPSTWILLAGGLGAVVLAARRKVPPAK